MRTPRRPRADTSTRIQRADVAGVVRIHPELLRSAHDLVVDRAYDRFGIRIHGREGVDDRHPGAVAVVQGVAALEQALALTSMGRARAACRAPRGPSSPRDDRHPRRSGGSGPVAGARIRAEDPAPRLGLRRAQRRLRPAPQARNRPLIRSSGLNRPLRHRAFAPKSRGIDCAPASRFSGPTCSTCSPSPSNSPPAASPANRPNRSSGPDRAPLSGEDGVRPACVAT